MHERTPHRAQIKGFNLRGWVGKNRARVRNVVEALGKLVAAGKLQATYTECAAASPTHSNLH